MVRRRLDRMVNSWKRGSTCGRLGVLRELACRAPHAPSESQFHFVFGELCAKIRRTTSDRDALKRLQPRPSDGTNSAVNAANKLSNRPDRTASECVHKNQVPERMCSDRVVEVHCAVRIQR